VILDIFREFGVFFPTFGHKNRAFLKFLMDLCFEMVPLWRSDNDLAISTGFASCNYVTLFDLFSNQ